MRLGRGDAAASSRFKSIRRMTRLISILNESNLPSDSVHAKSRKKLPTRCASRARDIADFASQARSGSEVTRKFEMSHQLRNLDKRRPRNMSNVRSTCWFDLRETNTII